MYADSGAAQHSPERGRGKGRGGKIWKVREIGNALLFLGGLGREKEKNADQQYSPD